MFTYYAYYIILKIVTLTQFFYLSFAWLYVLFTLYISLILVPDRRSGTNSCKIASAGLEFYAICHLSILHVRQSSLYILYCFFLSVMPPKDLAPFSYIYPQKTF